MKCHGMDAALIYDTTHLIALREELLQINETALASGLIAVRDGSPVWPARARRGAGGGGAKPDRKPSGSAKATTQSSPLDVSKAGEIGKAGALRLLAMAGRIAADESPAVPGTDFTEAGIVRLLAHLRKRRSKGFRFLQRLYRFLTRPVMMGTHTSAGISVERLQLVSRQLREIEADGWHRFRAVHAARRGKAASDVPAPGRQTAKSVGTGTGRAKTATAAKPRAPKSAQGKPGPVVKAATEPSARKKTAKRKAS